MRGGQLRLDAIARGDKRYAGRLCPRGHGWRYTNDDSCCDCAKLRVRRMRNVIHPRLDLAVPLPLPRRTVRAPVTGSAFIAPLPIARLMAGR